MKKISRRSKARIITFVSAAVIAVAIFSGTAVSKALQYARKNEAMYQKNLSEASAYLGDIGNVIVKGVYSESAADQSSMCADVWMNAYEAKNAISSLPIADIDMEKCYTFLSKTAEYARAAQKRIATGKRFDKSQHDTFLEIKTKTDALTKNFEKLENIYLSGNEKIAGGIDFSFEVPKTIASGAATSESLKSLNKSLTNAPQLLYDGPYADTIRQKAPEMLKNKSKITLSRASEIAEAFFTTRPGVLSYEGSSKGNIPTYNFRKGDSYLSVAVNGGNIVSFNGSEEATATRFSAKESVKIAQAYLKKAGYDNMKCDYYEIANHFYIMNFHYMQGDINCYTDLIKVKLNAQTGKVQGFDASVFLTCHRERALAFSLTAAQAQKALSPYVSVKQVKKALIPTPDEQEKLTYEFRCLSERGDELLVYIDALDGTQADLLILEIGKNGVLTK